MVFRTFFALLVCLISSLALGQDTELTLYTSRKSHLIEPLLKAYQEQKGVKIKVVNGKAGVLIEKLQREGKKSKADLFITVDAGTLGHAAELGLLSPLTNKKVTGSVPGEYRDKDNRWVGLSLRARTLFYNKDKVKPTELKSYEDLASAQWKGRLCLRTSRKVYNQSLVAGLIKRMGEKKTKEVVEGWVNNLARPVFTSDTLLLKAISRGECQVGLANTYYLARLLKKGEAKNVGLFWPTAKQGGVHINVSGGGVVAASSQKQAAEEFLAWLLSNEAQGLFASINHEYPVVKGVPMSDLLKSWGRFEKDQTPLPSLKGLQKRAVLIMDQARYK